MKTRSKIFKKSIGICLLMLLTTLPNVACSLTPKEANEINIPYKMEQERELQKSVDNGHQPWRLNPVDVAHEAIISYMDKHVKYEQCSMVTQKNEEAVVKCFRNKLKYNVFLKRFFGKDSIWTAVKIKKIKQ